LKHGRKVLVVVPNDELRRSIEFTVEAEGYEIESHAGFPTVFASHKMNGFDCAVVDEDAVDAGQRNLIEFARIAGGERPVVVLVDRTVALAESVPFRLLRKPLLGPALIDAIVDRGKDTPPEGPST
jgi:DNA-binding response OmpR family regulator